MAREKAEEQSVTMGSGNVFADLGLPNPEERLAKSKLASTIQSVVEARGLTQRKAAELMGIDQPKVSKILHGRLSEFSTEWLLTRLLRLGIDVDIVLHTQAPAKESMGAINVSSL